MDLQEFLIEIAIIAIPGIIIVSAAYYLIKNDIQRYFGLKGLETQKDEKAQLLTLRLQAHERLIIFIERINPANLFVRLHQQGIGVREFQSVLLNEIRSEYQHNVTQQLYVGATSWNVLSKLKEDTLGMINNVAQSLPVDASGVDLSKKVLQHMAGMENNPYDLTIDLIKKDIHQLYSL